MQSDFLIAKEFFVSFSQNEKLMFPRIRIFIFIFILENNLLEYFSIKKYHLFYIFECQKKEWLMHCTYVGVYKND